MSVDASYDISGTGKINHLEYRLAKKFDANWDNVLSKEERLSLLTSLDKVPNQFYFTDDLHPDNILSSYYV